MMMRDPRRLLGASLPDSTSGWTADQVILYHLAAGAGLSGASAEELPYIYEKNLEVLPTFGVIPGFGAVAGLNDVPGLEIDLTRLLHIAHDIEIPKPIPSEGRARHSGRIEAVYDEQTGARLLVEIESFDQHGDLLFTNRFSILLLGAGGFGGEPAPPRGQPRPSRTPDLVVDTPVLPNQAALYRLLGDKNPLHIDPDFARRAGYTRPPLHGLCTFSMVCKAVIDHAQGGDGRSVGRIQAAFAGPVFPGDTIATEMWCEDGLVTVASKVKERGTPVIAAGTVQFRGGVPANRKRIRVNVP